jgi:hypothetical protein
MRNEEVMGKTIKIGPTLSQIWLSVTNKKTSPLRGDACAHSLLGSLQVDLQVQNFKKEDKFSYNVQLSDR